jgi:PadR family transcriptional regulator, regulatory protein PadR
LAKVANVMQGTLDLLILKALALTPTHGWGISNHIGQLSGGVFRIGQGSLYPALHRFENRRWVISYWRQTPNNRIARFYELTAAGKRALEDEIAVWRSYTSAMDLVIEARS